MQHSPWSENVQVYHGAIQTYGQASSKAYDLIVANPPFFAQSTKAPECARNLARHNDRLRPEDLLDAAERLLSPLGRLCVIYPPDIGQIFLQQAQACGFRCQRQLKVQPHPTASVKRLLLDISKNRVDYQEETIVVEFRRHGYTKAFVALIKNFYLKYQST